MVFIVHSICPLIFTSIEEEVEQFYVDLQTVNNRIPKNVHYHGRSECKNRRRRRRQRVWNNYGLRKWNECGQICLLSFFKQISLIQPTPSSSSHIIDAYWYPRWKIWNQMDCIMIDKPWRSTVLNSKTRLEAWIVTQITYFWQQN